MSNREDRAELDLLIERMDVLCGRLGEDNPFDRMKRQRDEAVAECDKWIAEEKCARSLAVDRLNTLNEVRKAARVAAIQLDIGLKYVESGFKVAMAIADERADTHRFADEGFDLDMLDQLEGE